MDKEEKIRQQISLHQEHLPATFCFANVRYFEGGIITGNTAGAKGYLNLKKYQTPSAATYPFHKHISRPVSFSQFNEE